VSEERERVREALRELGVQDLVLGIHDLAFPCDADDDTGRGTPYSPAASRFLRFAAELGFDGVQLGPQGRRPPGDASPYDGCLFARDELGISLARLASPEEGDWLRRETLAALVAARPPGSETRVPYPYVERAHGEALREAFASFASREAAGDPSARELSRAMQRFGERHAAWLEPSALFGLLARLHRGASSESWSGPGDAALDARLYDPAPGEEDACARRRSALAGLHGEALRYETFVQLLAHEQHARLQDALRGLGLRLLADLQIGAGSQDLWAEQRAFLRGYALGAPPSRTNPEGQPWHYPVLAPDRLGDLDRPGPALSLLSRRIDKTFDEYDAVRIDHPHGLVCPWVYRRHASDPLRAVQQGARLYAAPDLPDHPELARFAIARRAQLNPDPRTPRYADDWVVALDERQVERYALCFDAIVASARRHGRSAADLVCEVLSTQPYPLERVLQRHGLGRFRVTQKADLGDPRDGYRSENARPEDWIMVGNHDTEPLEARLDAWGAGGELTARAGYLAERLAPAPAARAAFAEALLRERTRLVDAQFADLFASPARHAMVYFTDLFGEREPYNRPGTVSPDNWTLRVPRDFERAYRTSLASGRGLALPAALALALRARGGEAREALARRLEGDAARLRAG
jgi:4-alpha-glucanotransferase